MRGRWRLIVALVVALAALAAGFWFVWLPSYRPSLRPGERYGIDVSHHQNEVAWQEVRGDGIAFAYIKATEGGDHVDSRFASNWAGAGRAGLDRGAYHFFTLCRPGAEQAENFLRVVPDDNAELAPAVDLELAGNCRARPPTTVVLRELRTFLDLVEARAGQRAVLYVGDEFEERYPVRDVLRRPLWHFRFLRRPNVDRWVVWQVSGFARVDGVSGRVDLDVMR